MEFKRICKRNKLKMCDKVYPRNVATWIIDIYFIKKERRSVSKNVVRIKRKWCERHIIEDKNISRRHTRQDLTRITCTCVYFDTKLSSCYMPHNYNILHTWLLIISKVTKSSYKQIISIYIWDQNIYLWNRSAMQYVLLRSVGYLLHRKGRDKTMECPSYI